MMMSRSSPCRGRHRRRDGFCCRAKSGNDLWKGVIMQGQLLQAPSIERFQDWMIFVIGRPRGDGFDNDIVDFGAAGQSNSFVS
jgi:hypothetical protein